MLTRRGQALNGKELLRIVKRIGNRAKVANVNCHRFRHAFSVNALRRGAGYSDVGRMIGDSAATVENYYAAFAPKLQQRLRRFVDGGAQMEGAGRHTEDTHARPEVRVT